MAEEEVEDSSAPEGPLVIWTAEENNRTLVRDQEIVDENDAATEDSPTGEFYTDYLRYCRVLEIMPHPKLRPPPPADEPEPEPEPAADPKAKKGKADPKKGAAGPPEVDEVRVGGWTLDLGTTTALAMTLNSCSSVTTLRLWNAGLDLESLKLLAGCLEPDSCLQRLYLDFNPVEEDLEEKGEDDAEPESIFAAFTAPSSPLQLLSLRGNGITTAKAASMFAKLQDNKNLMSLNLWGNELTDPAMPDLSNALLINKTLTHLSLAKNRLSNEGAVSLMRCLTSEVVDKEQAKVLKKDNIATSAVKGVTFRDANQTLRVLNLGHNQITDPGCLEILYTVNQNLRPDTAAVEPEAADAEPKGKKSKKGGAPAKAEKILGKDSKVETVDLKFNPFTPAVQKMLAAEDKIEVQPGGEEEEKAPAEEAPEAS